MGETVSAQATRYVRTERAAGRYDAPLQARATGQVLPPLRLEQAAARELLQASARRAAGLFRASTHTQIVWVEGQRELAIELKGLDIVFGEGLVTVLLPVFCEQTGAARVQVAFAVGSIKQPGGLFASTLKRPVGPEPVVQAWSDALVAFAWDCLLGMVADLAGAVGKDARGNRLVPVEMAAAPALLMVWPMARHRFAGGTGLDTSLIR